MKNRALVEFGIRYPKVVISLSVLITIFFLLAFPSIQTDTDPVHMLPQNNPAIKLYEKSKEQFSINDLVVVGIQSKNGDSLFNAKQLKRIHDLTKDILTIREDNSPVTGVLKKVMMALRMNKKVKSEESHNRIFIEEDVVSLSTIDDIILNENKELLLRPLMENAPETDEQAKGILASINSNPLFKDKLAAKDGKLVGIYLPLYNGKKDQSYYLSQEIEKRVKKYLSSEEQYFIAGLPVAENTFGNEMFVQMRVYAPLAGLVIFILLYYFFRNFKLILAPMMVAIMTVIWSMGALIYTGQKIHIMSSMIPIFLMPIAVLDAVHILSTLHDKMPSFKSRIEAVRSVMGELYKPMLFTTVTTFVGFISLSTTGIPPVILFGITIGGGVLVAWLLSMVFMPAYTVLLSDKTFKNFGANHSERQSWVLKVIPFFKKIAEGNQKLVILIALITMGVSLLGVNSIIVNDNPVRWFKKDHALRKADEIMNQKLAGTYQANLIFDIPLKNETSKVTDSVSNIDDEFGGGDSEDDFSTTESKQLPSIRDPQVIRYISRVSDFLTNFRDEDGNQLVGAVTSIVDILKKVGQVAFNDESLPDTREKVSQYMFLFESGDSQKGRDMWKFITPIDSLSAEAWIQIKTGDNQKMILLEEKLAEFMKNNPPPILTDGEGKDVQLQVKWSGLNYINKVWQDELVSGMAKSLIGSFFIVFIMMVGLFRSIKWGFIAMLPLSLTILFIYGIIGFSGKFYDMPIAVLSSLTLGLSVDFAIHLIQHARQMNEESRNVDKTFLHIFGETAQAIWRNVLVISIGFSPLFFATLVPYRTVGFFFFGIMIVSGVATLILLPAIIKLFHPWLPSFGAK